jgi:Fe-S cluster assembly protein SufD
MAMLKRVEKLTAAEEAMLEASERLPSSDAKQTAYMMLRDHGLPTRRIEAWHYTDLRNHLKAFPPIAQPACKKDDRHCE